jgi:predicted nucleic-acid-binding protein
MEIVDANVVLRYLLNDNKAFIIEAGNIIENRQIHLPNEVCAEIVYVLQKVYEVPRQDIAKSIILLLEYPNITADKLVLNEALNIYHTKNIDFIDSILIASNHVMGALIHTFDNKIRKLCI